MTATAAKPDFVAVGRALLLYLSSCAVLWCIWHSPLAPSRHWSQWIGFNVVVLLALPVLFRAVFLNEGLSAYGFTVGNRRRMWLWTAGLFAAVLPVLVYAARRPEFQTYYPRLHEARYSPAAFAYLCLTVVLYLFAWEYLFRGFLLFGLAKGLGAPLAIFLQAIPFGLSHFGKVPTEMYASFAAGWLLGWVCWRCRSFLPAFLVHALANLTLNALIVHATGTWL